MLARADDSAGAATVGVVVIGRNEGERLRRCLASVVGRAARVVYVDSASGDASVELARGLGASVVELDMSIPFTAARARNAGFERLRELAPDIALVQFVDGDCEIVPGWLESAVAEFAARPWVSVLAGRLNERFPEQSVYNRLGDLEWNAAGAGEVPAVGGIFMIRRAVFEAVDGFDASIGAGEEPELCQRILDRGGRIWRLDRAMAWHDLAMHRLGQWWRRQIRNGYGGLDVTRRFGLARFRRNILRARFWSLWPLLVALAGSAAGMLAGPATGLATAALVFGLWPAQMMRIAWRAWRAGQPPDVALAFAFFTLLASWPQMLGQLGYLRDQRGGAGYRRFEYKSAAPARAAD